jgi:hypothetical protein
MQQQPDNWPERPHNQFQTIRRVRWILVAVTAALAVALIVKGDTLIGVFVAAMAIMRGWMLVTMPRRMAAMRAQREARMQEWRAGERPL